MVLQLLIRYTADFYANDQKPPATLTAPIKKTPRRVRESLTRAVAIAPDLPLPLVEDEPGPPVVDEPGGTNVPVADARQELATAGADPVEALFTVAFPANLHASALRWFPS